MPSPRHLLLGLGLALSLAGCATLQQQHERAVDRKAAYDAAAGKPVDSFNMFTLYSWEPLGEDQVAIYTRPDQAYLLSFFGPCLNLPYANAIGLTSNLGQVTVNFDKVLAGGDQPPCTIRTIQPVDLGALKLVRQAQRQIRVEQRKPPLPPPGSAPVPPAAADQH